MENEKNTPKLIQIENGMENYMIDSSVYCNPMKKKWGGGGGCKKCVNDNLVDCLCAVKS